MNIPVESFKINLNQNLWGLIVSFAALGIADYYNLNALFWLSLITSIAASASTILTTGVYTYKYCLAKMAGTKS